MDLSIFRITKRSFLCTVSIVIIELVLNFILLEFFPSFNSAWSPAIILMIDGFLNGIIFGNVLTKSTAQLIVFTEILFLLYLAIIFTFNPWGNATHIPLSLLSIPALFIVIGLFGSFGLLFFGIMSLNIILFGSWGVSLRDRVLNNSHHKEILQ